jgi:hypothetical protein
MSTNPISFRFPFESQISKLPPEHQIVVRTQWNAITDLQGAIPALKSQIDTMNTAVSAATAATQNITNNSETVVSAPNTIGNVNNQEGETSYTTQPSDNGVFVILGDTSPVALTLGAGSAFQLPFFVIILNFGSGLVTVTPSSGTITYPANLDAASMPIPQNVGAMMSYDGANFWSVVFPVSPQNTPAISHEWINSYNASTGIFTQTQPAFADVSGVATTAQIGTGTPSAGKYVDGGTGAWTTLPVIGYSLGGTLTTANVALGAGAGTGATVTSVAGLDGNHVITIETGTSPATSATIFTVTFTVPRGQPTYPIPVLQNRVYSALNQIVTPVGGSSTQYSLMGGATSLNSPGASYVFYVSCP